MAVRHRPLAYRVCKGRFFLTRKSKLKSGSTGFGLLHSVFRDAALRALFSAVRPH